MVLKRMCGEGEFRGNWLSHDDLDGWRVCVCVCVGTA